MINRKYIKLGLRTFCITAWTLCSSVFIPLCSQTNSNITTLIIGAKNPIEVELVSRLNMENKRSEFYYLPVNLRVSINQNNQPELLYMSWDSDNQKSEPQGILHWILTWGLTVAQEKEIQERLVKQIDSTAILMGSLSVQAALQDFKITGPNDSMILLLSKNITSGASIPTQAGSKSATAFKFTGPDAQNVISTFKNTDKWKQVYIEMPFNFNLPTGGSGSKVLKLEVKTIFKQLYSCKECLKLI
jgi:hypothetical protein